MKPKALEWMMRTAFLAFAFSGKINKIIIFHEL
jgi:hypothetical protein